MAGGFGVWGRGGGGGGRGLDRDEVVEEDNVLCFEGRTTVLVSWVESVIVLYQLKIHQTFSWTIFA